MKVERLGSLATFLSGFAFKSNLFNSEGKGTPIIRIRDVVRGRSETYFSGEYDDRYLVKKGDYLIGMDGEFNLARWNSEPALLNQRVCKIDSLSQTIDRAYLGRFLPAALKQIEDATPFVTVKHLSVKTLNEIQIPLPPLAEQKRIAAILDAADALRTKRRESLAQLDALLQSTFLNLFGDAAFNAKKWPRVPLVGVCKSSDDIKCGPFGTQLNKDEFRTEGVPLWGIKNVNKFFELATHEFLEARTARRLIQYSIEPGDIVMTRKGTVGNCAVYPERLPLGIMHSDLLRLRVNRAACEPIFLSHQLHYSRDVARQLALISGGAIMPGINVTRLKSLEVLLPPLPLQQKFAAIVESVERQKAAQRAHLAELDALFAALQHRAFRGEL